MKQAHRFISLAVALLMLIAATVTVNKTVARHSLVSDNNATPAESLATIEDGQVVIHTADAPGQINGYAGPIDFDITIQNGVIEDITILPNAETPSFMRRASVLVDSWIGKTPSEALGMKVDAITGATYSSLAIINNINAGLSAYEGSKAQAPAASTPWKIWIALAVTLAACILPLFVKNKFYRNVQLVANIVVLGFWCGQFLDYYLMLKYISEGVILPVGLVAIVMLVAAFIYPLLGHPQYYCTHICPLGSAQQLAAQICGYKVKMSRRVVKALDWFRKILWAVLMLLLWTDCLSEWMDFELFQAFRIESASWWIIGIALIFLGLSTIVTRPYCRFVCPTGSLFKRADNVD